MPISLQQVEQLLHKGGEQAQGAAQKLSDKSNGISPYLLPAALAGGGGGALMGYYASKGDVPGEAPRERRHRIIRNALMGLALGGTAGAALPAGFNTLASSVKPMAGFHPVDATANAALRHWGPTAAAAGSGLLGLHQLGKNRQQAAGYATNLLYPPERPLINGARNPMEDALMTRARNPATQGETVTSLGQRLGSPWKARELLGETGVHDFPRVRDMDGDDQAAALASLRQHLGNQGPISRLVSKLVGKSAPAGSVLDRYLPSGTDMAESYSRNIRPSVGGILSDEGIRLNTPVMLGLGGGAMLGANYLQNKLQGN